MPITEPAALLVELLREDRDRWAFEFDAAWQEDVEFVLRQLPTRRQRDERLNIFASQRRAWWAAWHRTPGPGANLTLALLYGLSENGLGADEPLAGNVEQFARSGLT